MQQQPEKQITPARAFVEALGDKVGQPVDKHCVFQIGGTMVQVYPADLDRLHINMIRTHEKLRNKGYARFAIEEMAAQADLYNVRLTLDCSYDNLRACFQSYGFKPTPTPVTSFSSFGMERLPSGQTPPESLYPR